MAAWWAWWTVVDSGGQWAVGEPLAVAPVPMPVPAPDASTSEWVVATIGDREHQPSLMAQRAITSRWLEAQC